MIRVLALLSAVAVLSGCAIIVLPGFEVPGGPLTQQIVQPAKEPFLPIFPKKVLLLDIDGPITDESSRGLFGRQENTVESLKEKLQTAQDDSSIAAVVLRINSPGGTVTASDIIYQEILRFKQARQVPVVACLMDVGASGGYYVALAADWIVAHPTTITGSVGVIAQMVHVRGLFDKIGVSTDTIKSGDMKDIGSPFRALTSEERALMQGIIDQLYTRFIGAVKSRRTNLSADQLERIGSGRVFVASDALENGLIDSVGYLDDAIEEAKNRAQIRKAHVVMYRKAFTHRGNIYARLQTLPSESMDINLFKLDASSLAMLQGRPVFLYFWQP